MLDDLRYTYHLEVRRISFKELDRGTNYSRAGVLSFYRYSTLS
jgi:hypothetical protein